MGRHYIKDKHGNQAKTSKGERLFWSDSDGDSNPKREQTVYREGKSIMDNIFGGSSKTDSKYAPSKGRFKK